MNIDETYKAGLADIFMPHSLGHFVGLDVHDVGDNVTYKSQKFFENGTFFTVEPGIYIKDFGGVRIEDLVVVTESGHINFTHSPKELIEV